MCIRDSDEAIYFEVSDTSEFTDFTYDTDDDGDPILYVSQFVEPSCDDSTFIEDDEVDYEYDALTAESCADSANAVWSPGGLTVMTLVPAESEFDSFEDAVSAYLMWKYKARDYYNGKLPRGIYIDMERNWARLCAQCRGNDNMPTPIEMKKAAADAMAKRVGVAESVLDRWSKLAGLED